MAAQAASERSWAAERFGHAELGDRRLTSRLVSTAARLAQRPAGTVTTVFDVASEREGAYRLLENRRVAYEPLETSLGQSCARRCASYDRVLVPLDGSSLNIVDTQRSKGFGAVGAFRAGAQGLIVQTALAVAPNGTPIDVIGQRYWARKTKRTKRASKSRTTETAYVLELIEAVKKRMAATAPTTQVWFQLDRGYDAQAVLRKLHDVGAHYTVRGSADRRVEDRDGRRQYLSEVLREAPVLGEYSVHVRDTSERPARIARVSVRATRVMLVMRRKSKCIDRLTLFAVEAREDVPNGLHWRLLTSEPAETFEQAMHVVRAYEARWRIEDFHRAWKDGCGHVEDTQLRSFGAVTKWATLHAAVAARATRLAHLARTTPDVPADTEFTRPELTAMVALATKKALAATDPPPTLVQAVGMCARLGGYTGKSSGGPPGATVIARGLQRVVDVAEVLEKLGSGSG